METEIAKGHIPLSQVKSTGLYREDFVFDVEKLAAINILKQGENYGLRLS